MVWTVSKQQLAPVNFFNTDELGNPLEKRSRFVLVGGVGSGKSETGVRAIGRFQFDYRDAHIGVVAPTANKLGITWRKFLRLLHPSWISDVRMAPLMEPPFILLKNGNKFQFLTASAPSKQKGTQIHGLDWIGALIDEEEQCSDAAVGDVYDRGREAVDGWYPVISTCTISDDPEFRARLEKYEKKQSVIDYHMSIYANPYVTKEYIELQKERHTERDFAQRVLAQKQKPQRATYPSYSIDTHVRPLPDVLSAGVVDVTKNVVGAEYLIGHDMGENFDVSVILKAYEIAGERIWYVLNELTTERTTSDEHAAELVEFLQQTYGAHMLQRTRAGKLEVDPMSPQVVIRADPHGTSEGKADETAYRYFQAYGFRIRPATYKKTKNPANAADPGVIKVKARVAMLNVLFRNAAGRTRLYLAEASTGLAKAERLSNALSMSQNDEQFRPEKQRKDIHDLSHWPSSTGFALWGYEHARIGMGVQ